MQSLERAREAAEKALDIEEDNPDALGLLGKVLLLEEEQDRAVEVMEKAVRLAPNHAFNTAVLSDALFFAGRMEESAEKIKRAMRLSPIYPAWYLAMLGACYHVRC